MENFRLTVFRAVARHLHFRRAAEELRLTQPAITGQIRALEEELDAQLFDRAGGRVALTPQGNILLDYANRLHLLSEEALQALAAATGKSAGSLSIGASQTIGQYLLPNLLAGFLHEYPEIAITTSGGNTEEVLEALAAHDIDIALIEGPAMRTDVKTEPFLEDQMVLAVPAGHAWADARISLADLLSSPLLARERGSGSRRVVEAALEQAGITKRELHYRLTFDSTEGLLSAVEAGLGVAFVSRWAVRNQLSLGTLHLAHVRGLKLSRMLSIAYLGGPPPSGNAGDFHKFALAYASALLPRVTGIPRLRKVSRV